jgi:GH35 family endo-1,4-beta-xylanase
MELFHFATLNTVQVIYGQLLRGRKTMMKKPHLALPVVLLLLAAGSAHADITLSGNISSSSGDDPAYAFVYAMDAETLASLGLAPADGSGHYTIDLPEETAVILLSGGSTGAVDNGYNLHEFRESIDHLQTTDVDVEKDFVLDPSFELVLTDIQEEMPSIIVASMDDRAIHTLTLGVEKDGGEDVIGFNLPTGDSRYKLYADWTLPHAGRIMAHIDNGGIGFGDDDQGHALVSFRMQLALDAVARLTAKLAAFSEDAELAEVYLTDAQTAVSEEDFDEAAGLAIVGEEEWALAKARTGIEQYRKGELTVTVVDKFGDPLPGADVTIEQIDRDFMFGYFDDPDMLGETLMEQARQDGFDYFTMGVYWTLSEPTDDAFGWTTLDYIVDAASAYAIKGHPLLWFSDYTMPAYTSELSGQDLLDEIDEHLTEIVSRYSDDVVGWDVINEAHGFPAMGGMDRAAITQITKDAVDLVKILDPDSFTVVNCSFDWFGQSMVSEFILGETAEFKSMPLIPYMQGLLDAGVDFDIYGQQMYNGGCITVFSEWGIGDPIKVDVYDLGEIHRMLDRVGEVGLPAQLTEQSVPSDMADECPEMGYWRAPWTEQVQADFVTSFYTLVFGTEHFHSATWWNLIDGDAFIKHGGMIHEDKTPKQAYNDLTALFGQWWTDAEDQTDGAGELATRVFAGNHNVTASYEGESEAVTVTVAEKGEHSIQIALNVVAPADDDDLDDDDADDDDDTGDDDDDDSGCGC